MSFRFQSRHNVVVMSASCVLALFAERAAAQVATSPDVALPEIVITSDPTSTQPAKAKDRRKTKPNTAPTAAQQSSTPPGAKSADGSAGSDAGAEAVSATGTPTDVGKVASSVTVVTGADIEARQQRTAPQVLRDVPGVQVVQGGGPGARTSIFIRGTESDHSKVYIDGIDVSDPSSGGRTFDFGQLLTYDIERIEVLRGPQSGLYGADAIGGVIVVHTKKGEGPPKFTALAEGGSFGTFNQAAGVSGGENGFNYAFNVGHFRATDVPVTPLDYLPPGTRRFNNSYDNWTASTKLGYDFSQAFSVNAVARYTDSDFRFTADDPLSFPTVPENYQSSALNKQLFLRSEGVWRAAGGFATSIFGVSYSDTGSDSINPVDRTQSVYSDGDRIKYDWRTIFSVAPGVTATVGADYQNETLHSQSEYTIFMVPGIFQQTIDADEWNKGVFGQVQAEVVENLVVAANIRHDENENFGGATTWRVAPSYYVAATGTTFKASYGTAFKAPSLVDRFVDFPAFFFMANPNLRPEESEGWDAGFEQALFNERFRFGATYFHNDITDLIAGDPDKGFTTTTNIGRATTEGVEVFVSANLTDSVRVRADYTFTDARDEKTGKVLKRRPQDKASVSVGWTPAERWLLTASLLYTGDSEDFDRAFFSEITLPSYTVVNVAAEYALNDNATLFGRIDNLFDKHYQVPAGFDATGIGGYAGVRFNY